MICEIVLIYPVFRMRQRLRRRVVGDAFWKGLEKRRTELYNFGLDRPFVSHADIIQASFAQMGREKQVNALRDRPQSFWNRSFRKTFRGAIRSFGSISRPSVIPLPRSKYDTSDAQHLGCFSDEKEAWKISSDNLLASIHVRNLMRSKPAEFTPESMADEFDRISNDLKCGKLTDSECSSIHKSVVKAHGYQFAKFIFDLSHAANTVRSREEKHIIDRFSSAFERGERITPDASHIQEVSRWVFMFSEENSSMIPRQSASFTTISGRACLLGSPPFCEERFRPASFGRQWDLAQVFRLQMIGIAPCAAIFPAAGRIRCNAGGGYAKRALPLSGQGNRESSPRPWQGIQTRRRGASWDHRLGGTAGPSGGR